jgi:hypothetical protein
MREPESANMSQNRTRILNAFSAGTATLLFIAWAQQPPASRPQRDAVSEAQQPSQVKAARPEQQKTPHDNADVFNPAKASPSSPVFETQPKQGRVSGFDFARDPLNADRPNQPPEESPTSPTSWRRSENTSKANIFSSPNSIPR